MKIDYNEQIADLYQKVDDKGAAINDVRIAFGKAYSTVKGHWLRRFPAVPKEHQKQVVDILKDIIEQQNIEKAVES